MKLAVFFLVSAIWCAADQPLVTSLEPKLGPDNFHGIDFNNFSYPYRLSSGRNIQVALKNGEYEYGQRIERGSFILSQVYIADITGDKRPEAIVMLWHTTCGASCDGGSALFFIYHFQNRELKPLWQYETGSLAYGCGLKFFAAKKTTLTVELFGRCSKRNRAFNQTSLRKFHANGVTRVTFKSNGLRFVAHKREFFSSPERSVLNYEPQISIAK